MSDLTGSDRLLLDRIIAGYRETRQFIAAFAADDIEGIERFRALGRLAGRELGWKVRTFVTKRDDGGDEVAVICVVAESTPLHEELMRIRGDKAIRQAMESWIPKLGEDR